MYAPYKLVDDFPVILEKTTLGDDPVTFLHIHNCSEVGYCHEGSGVFIVGGKVLAYNEGDVIVITSEEAHIARSTAGTQSNWSFLLIHMDCLLQKVLLNVPDTLHSKVGWGTSNILSAKHYPKIARIARLMIDELDSREDHYKEVFMGLYTAFYACLTRYANKQDLETQRTRPVEYDKVAPALAYIAENYRSDVSMSTLAKLCHASDRTVRRWFEETVGTNPQDYICRIRLSMAAALLRDNNWAIMTVANHVGYSSPSSFARHFREYLGVTPSQWRKG